MADPARPETSGAGIGEDHLRACTVRIDVAGSPKGTGFFVAPGQVVTCAHVLETLDTSAPGAAAQILAVGLGDEVYPVVGVPDRWDDEDLAVLRVDAAPSHRCVLLYEGLRAYDRAMTFGFVGRHPEGVVRTLEGEGRTGDDRLLGFGSGQVQPGLSGAPVLNLRTGGVCGVLSVTRNEQQSLGGYAIPVERLGLRSPTIVRQNREYHLACREEWFDLLPQPEKQVLVGSGPRTAADSGFSRSLVVCVGGDENDWEVTARVLPGDTVAAERAEVNLNRVREKVARLFRDWAARGRAGPWELAPGRFDPGEDIRLLGTILFSAVLPGEIGKRFEAMLPTGDERMLLALHLSPRMPREFVEMPWEHLYLVRPGVLADIPLARAERVAFVRVLTHEPAEPVAPTRRRLSVLMIGVTPPEQAGESPTDQVLDKAHDLAGRLEGLDIEMSSREPPGRVRDKLRRGPYDIVHYVGFGRYERGADRLALGGSPDYEFHDADAFATELTSQRPRLVVLQQIDGPKDVVPADLSGFAWDLLNRGVEAVVAYQFPLPAWLSVSFNEAFYEQLVSGECFEMAVQNARTELWMRKQDQHAYLSPAAFVIRPGEVRLTAAAPASTPIARAGVTVSHA